MTTAAPADQSRPPDPSLHPFPKEEIEQSIPARFEQQVRRYPKRLAVKTRSHALTYEALNRAANQVTDLIIARRALGEDPVALLLEQGAPLIAAILGVLEASKCYAPIEPALGSARISAMLADLQAALIMTNDRHLALA
jgi:non-ribosomal peptide synthetase component F